MLPLVYNDFELAKKIAEDPLGAPIPDLHRAMYAWVEKFVRRSWEMDESDIQSLRDAGASDSDIVEWAQVACMQSWWVMMGDGGGVKLDGDAPIGPVVGHERDWYSSSEEGLLAAAPRRFADDGPRSKGGWVGSDESTEEYKEASSLMSERYGFVPNLVKASSLAPASLRRHAYALEILEGPQSSSLTPLQHALVRALVSNANRCEYSAVTTRALVESMAKGEEAYAKVAGDWESADWNERDRVVLEFAVKVARSTYKITEKDAKGFRSVGLDDEAYVDVLNTVAIQTSFDRLANSLGIAVDDRPILVPTESRV